MPKILTDIAVELVCPLAESHMPHSRIGFLSSLFPYLGASEYFLILAPARHFCQCWPKLTDPISLSHSGSISFARVCRFVTLFKFQPSHMIFSFSLFIASQDDHGVADRKERILSETHTSCMVEVGSGIISACLPVPLQLMSGCFNTSQTKPVANPWPGVRGSVRPAVSKPPVNSAVAYSPVSVHSTHLQNEVAVKSVIILVHL